MLRIAACCTGGLTGPSYAARRSAAKASMSTSSRRSITTGSALASGAGSAMNSGVTTAPRPGLASNVSLMIATPTTSIAELLTRCHGGDGHGVADGTIDRPQGDAATAISRDDLGTRPSMIGGGSASTSASIGTKACTQATSSPISRSAPVMPARAARDLVLAIGQRLLHGVDADGTAADGEVPHRAVALRGVGQVVQAGCQAHGDDGHDHSRGDPDERRARLEEGLQTQLGAPG